jgi:hypothetical protein
MTDPNTHPRCDGLDGIDDRGCALELGHVGICTPIPPLEYGDGPSPEEEQRVMEDALELAELKMRDPLTLTGPEKQRLAAAAAAENAPPVDDGDATPLHLRDPRTLTGQQKSQLAGRAPLLKPKPRSVLTPDGRDPRTLTGPEKLLLGQSGSNKRLAPVPMAAPPDTSGLSDAERHELQMLRAFQTDVGIAPADVDAREELRLRKQWHKPKTQPRKPPPIGTRHEDE